MHNPWMLSFSGHFECQTRIRPMLQRDPLCHEHCVLNKMLEHSASNTEHAMLLGQRTCDAVGTKNT